MRLNAGQLTRRRAMALALALVRRPAAAAPADLFPPEQLARIRSGLQAIYNLEHARAAADFERMISESPADPAGYVYLAMTLWLRELSIRQELSIERFAASDFFAENPAGNPPVDPSLESRFRAVSAQAIDKARVLPSDRRNLFLLGVACQNLACFEAALKRNWWAAFRWGVRAYGYNQELLRRDPAFIDARLAIGVYQYAAGSLGWRTRWLAFLMGYRGSRTRARQELETVARQGLLSSDDARVILVLIYTRERDFERAYAHLEELHRKYPRNYLVYLDMAGLALRMKDSSRATRIYRDILRDPPSARATDLARQGLARNR